MVSSVANYEFVSSFGSFGTSPGQFDDPRGVAVNQHGIIIITESGNDRVQLCDNLGGCTAFGSFGVESGEFDRPRGVAVNSADRIFVADRGNDRIQNCGNTGICTDYGGSGTEVGKFESPRGIAIDGADQMYITDTDNNRIQSCNEMGVCTSFGTLGTSLGQFNSPSGIGVTSSGKLVIADRGNSRIQVCTTQGSCTAFGSLGSGPGQFNDPSGIAINSQDQIIVVDRFNDRVQVCSEQGICTAFGSFGSGPGQFNAPWGVGVDSQDRIIIADLGNDRIQIFADTAGVLINGFSATEETIEEGQSTSLSWTVSNATTCVALDGNDAWRTLTPNAVSGEVEITLDSPGDYTFTLQCTDGNSTVSVQVVVSVTAFVLLEMNAGLNDAWFYPVTDGQGFFITVFPDLGVVTLAWFTYDTVRPDDDAVANLGEAGHRWLTALGVYSGPEAVMDITMTSGGIFDTATEISRRTDGTIILTFSDCNTGTIEYDIPSISQQGIVPIQRIASDNIALCRALADQSP